MKPLDEKTIGDFLSDPHWPRQHHAGEPADTISQNGEHLLRSMATMHGEDPDAVIELVRKDNALARTVLKALGIEPFIKKRVGRPSKTSGNFHEHDTVMALRDEGLKGDELWETARERLGTDKTIESLKRTLTRTRKKHPIALAFANHPPQRTKPK